MAQVSDPVDQRDPRLKVRVGIRIAAEEGRLQDSLRRRRCLEQRLCLHHSLCKLSCLLDRNTSDLD